MTHHSKRPAIYTEFLAFAHSLALDSGAIAFAQVGASSARRKFDGSLVTKTDELIDHLISVRIKADYPTHAILSEEQSTTYDPTDSFTWVVDPVDGTTNFARGMPIWGVSVGLLLNGAPIVGVVNFPCLHEIYSAVSGAGAQRNGEPIHAAEVDEVDDQHLFMQCTRTPKRLQIDTPLKMRMMGSAAYHVCKVADGSAIAGSEATPKVWDMAAAALILSEAGGAMVTLSGEQVFPLAPQALDYGARSYPLLYACNQQALDHLRGHVRPRIDKA